MVSVYLERLRLRSSGPLLDGQQSRPLVVLLLSGLGQGRRQILRLLEEVHQRLLRQQGGQDLRVADPPLALRLRRVFPGRLLRTVAGLADLQHEAGYLGDGLEKVTLLGVVVEQAVQRLAELDELVLWKEIGGVQRPLAAITDHYNSVTSTLRCFLLRMENEERKTVFM